MAIPRTAIERALDDLVSHEEGMRFQGLAVVLGKKRWPQLIAHERKKDFGLDAYAPPSQTPEGVGKGLAASITPTLRKISFDAQTAKTKFPELKQLLFVTAGKVGNADRIKWGNELQQKHGLELLIIGREEIITLLMMPEHADLGPRFLHLDVDSETQLADVIDRTRGAAVAVTRAWARRTRGQPLVDLAAARLDPNGAESSDELSLEQIDQLLSQSRRIVLEGPAGRGKTTTLVQLAQRPRDAGTPLLVDFPAWTSSRLGILDHIAGMPAFLAAGLAAADLARVQQTEPLLFLLNGWNEIAESNSANASAALRELERYFPSAGIIVATRTHHLTPPLPGALRLRLLRLHRAQREAYLVARLGDQGAALRTRLDADLSLDELTLNPFTLSVVASLFEVNTAIPSTRIGVLAQVVRVQAERDEHRNALQAAPIFGRQVDYLKALATEMTRCGAVLLTEGDACATVAAVAGELAKNGQIDIVGPPTILAALAGHHLLERVDYPKVAFRFEHQQLQEYFAALDIREQLFNLVDDHNVTDRFAVDYVNDPAWAEPLRMIAEACAEPAEDGGTNERNTRAGAKLVEMALAVDLVFAGELAQLCGPRVWDRVRALVGERLRSVYAFPDGNYRQYAVAAMLAAAHDDFSDIIVPLLLDNDQQTRLGTYRLWPDLRVSSLGRKWRDEVRGWTEEARADFVSQLLHHRMDGEVAVFAADDASMVVKKAAVEGLMWTKSDAMLTVVLESMDTQTFDEVVREHVKLMPTAMRSKTVTAMRSFIESSTDHPARLRAALDLVGIGETDLDGIIKDAMAALPAGDMRTLARHYIQPALEYLCSIDRAWASEWVAMQVAKGALYDCEYWLRFATAVPDSLAEKCLQRLKTEDLKNRRFAGMIAVIAARADARIAARVFAELRELRQHVDAAAGQPREFEWNLMRQLGALFHSFPDDVAAAGVIDSVTDGNALDLRVAADLLGRVARSDLDPLRVADDDLKALLHAYLKRSVGLVLDQDDFAGAEKANLASSIAQVGEPEDVADLRTLIRADIKRMRRGRAAHAAGDRGPLGNGGSISYARWHIAAVMQLDSAAAEQVLIDLLAEPEYRADAAAAMALDYVPKPDRSFDRTFRYDVMWSAREGRTPPCANDQRRVRYGAALHAEIELLRQEMGDARSVADVTELAKALAAVDGRGFAPAVLDVIAIPDRLRPYNRLDAMERLFMAGVVLPASAAFPLL